MKMRVKGLVTLLWLPVTSCLTLIPSSCTIDAYDKGEGEYSLLTAELVEAHVGSDKYVDGLQTDGGGQLSVQNRYTAKWIQTADTTYRALLYYNNVGDGQAEIVSLSRVGVLQPRDSISGGMKTDPLYLESSWMGKSRKYVNLRLRLLTGSTDDENAIQALAIVVDTLRSTPSHARLTLYHSQGGQPEYYSVTTFASLPLAAVAADTVTVTVNTYGGTVSKIFVK